MPGLNKLWYGPDYTLLKGFDMSLLEADDVPVLYHNAYNVDRQAIAAVFEQERQLSEDHHTDAMRLQRSAVHSVAGRDQWHDLCRRRDVDTVGFWHLLKDHPDLDEVWVCRILDSHQIRPHHNLVEALNNLVMLFASTTSEDDVKLFKFHLKDLNEQRAAEAAKSKTQPHLIDLIEFPVDYYTSYEWTHTNLRASTAASCVAARQTIQDYLAKGQREEAAAALLPYRHSTRRRWGLLLRGYRAEDRSEHVVLLDQCADVRIPEHEVEHKQETGETERNDDWEIG